MNCLLTRQPPLTRILMTERMAGPKSFLNLQHRTRSAAMIQLPPLPFAKDALSPHISAETLDCVCIRCEYSCCAQAHGNECGGYGVGLYRLCSGVCNGN